MFLSLTKAVNDRLPFDSEKLFKGAAFIETYQTLIIKFISLGLSFLITVLLARLLGAEGYGTYAYVLSWVNLLGIFAIFGIDRLLLRETAINKKQQNWDRLKGVLKWGNTVSLSIAIGLTLLAAFIAWCLMDENNVIIVQSLWIALILLPFMAITTLRKATMQGLQKVALGQIPEDIVRPLVFIILLGTTFLFFDDSVTTQYVLGFNVIGYVSAFVVGLYLLFKTIPPEIKLATAEYDGQKWIKAAMILSFLGAIHIVNREIRTLMLGSLGSIQDVGIYTVALRGADLILLPINVINAVIASKFASLYANNDMEGLQRLVLKSTRVILAITVPCALILISFSDLILSIFGDSFLGGKNTLIIICLGSVLSSSLGSVGLLLTMTGHESLAAKAVIYSLIFNILLNYILIPDLGAVGAAWSSAISLVCLTSIYAWWVIRELKIYPLPFRIQK